MMNFKACLNVTAAIILACLFPSAGLIQVSALETLKMMWDVVIGPQRSAM